MAGKNQGDAMSIDIVEGKLTIEADLVQGRRSKSGKSELLLTTSGNQELETLVLNGKPVTVSINVYQKVGG